MDALREPYVLTVFLTSLMIGIFALLLWIYAIPWEPEFRSYRRSRRLLSAVGFMLAVAGFTEAMVAAFSLPENFIQLVLLVVGGAAVALFIYALLALIDPEFVSRERVRRFLLLIAGVAVVLTLALVFLPSVWFRVLFGLDLAAYVFMVGLFVKWFTGRYRHFNQLLDEYFSDDMKTRLRWVLYAFWATLAAAVVVVVAIFFYSTSLYLIFAACYTVLYVAVAIKYIGYVPVYKSFVHAIMPSRVDPHLLRSSNANIAFILDRWVGEGGFRRRWLNLDHVASELRLPRRSLSLYINTHLNQSFYLWIMGLRITDCCKLLQADPSLPSSDLAAREGIASVELFETQFEQITGMPVEDYREKFAPGQ